MQVIVHDPYNVKPETLYLLYVSGKTLYSRVISVQDVLLLQFFLFFQSVIKA